MKRVRSEDRREARQENCQRYWFSRISVHSAAFTRHSRADSRKFTETQLLISIAAGKSSKALSALVALQSEHAKRSQRFSASFPDSIFLPRRVASLRDIAAKSVIARREKPTTTMCLWRISLCLLRIFSPAHGVLFVWLRLSKYRGADYLWNFFIWSLMIPPCVPVYRVFMPELTMFK